MSRDIPEDAGFEPPSFTDEQVDAIVRFIVAHGKARAKMQGSDFSEADFLAGAMTWFFALKMQGKLPAMWIFGIMRGDSPLEVEVPDRIVYVLHERGLGQVTAVYSDPNRAKEHLEWLWDRGDEKAYLQHEPALSKLDPRIQAKMDAEAEDAAIRREEDRAYGDK